MNAQTAKIQAREVFNYAQQFSKEQAAKQKVKEDLELKQSAKVERQKLDDGVKYLQRLAEIKINQAISCGKFETKFSVSKALVSEILECNYYLAFRDLVKNLKNEAFEVNYCHTDHNFNLEISWN